MPCSAAALILDLSSLPRSLHRAAQGCLSCFPATRAQTGPLSTVQGGARRLKWYRRRCPIRGCSSAARRGTAPRSPARCASPTTTKRATGNVDTHSPAPSEKPPSCTRPPLQQISSGHIAARLNYPSRPTPTWHDPCVPGSRLPHCQEGVRCNL